VQEHKQSAVTIGATSFNDHDRPPRRFLLGRVCAEYHCGTRLSIYNDGQYCTLHAPVVAPRLRGRKVIGHGKQKAKESGRDLDDSVGERRSI